MKNKLLKAVATMVAAVALTSSLTACGVNNPSQNSGKTTVFVWNYDGGVGHEWLNAVASRFEAANAETEFEAGKTGVKIEVLNDKDSDWGSVLSSSPYSVFFLEGVQYNSYQSQNKFLDITDIVTEEIKGEGRSIESKLNANTKASLGASGKYYVLPHYQSLNGVSYNKTFFDEKNLYFAKNESDYKNSNPSSPFYGFIKNADCEKTCGPDGVPGNYDDGLPSSIEEFNRLLNAIIELTAKPFVWFGGGASYQTSFVNALWASLEGYDGAMANFILDSNGKETEIITGFGADGKPSETEKVVIDETNYYKVYSQVSRYYALETAQKIFTDGRYYHKNSLTDTNSHTDIQGLFLESMYTDTPIAMIFEGSYWQNEAKDSGEWDRVMRAHPEAKDLEIRFMPLPVQVSGSVKEGEGRAPTVVDALNSYAFINANVKMKHGEGVEKAAKAFLKFCYTEESLKEFTLKSSVTKNLDYDMGEDVNKLSYYAQSAYKIYKEGSVVTAISPKAVAIKNPSVFTLHPGGEFWKTTAAPGYNNPYTGFRNGASAKDYFLGLAKTKSWADSLK